MAAHSRLGKRERVNWHPKEKYNCKEEPGGYPEIGGGWCAGLPPTGTFHTLKSKLEIQRGKPLLFLDFRIQ